MHKLIIFECVAVDLQTTEAKSVVEMDKNVAEHVQILSYKVKTHEQLLNSLCNQLKEERAARFALQSVVKNYLVSNSKDLDAIDWPSTETSSVS